MPRRIGAAVIRGEIDNTTEGLTTGTIWLVGYDFPLELVLEGDCWRDLAGCRLEFTNPTPAPEPAAVAGLDRHQRGVVGDITASRRTRTSPARPARPAGCEPWDPGTLRNSLYLEWFSESDGRVVIESDQFTLRPGEPRWRMDPDLEQAQKLANLQAMRDYLARRIGRREPGACGCGEGALSEAEWEARLAESERITDAYQEALDKYMDEPDSGQKEAFVMGWDGLLGAMADEHEQLQRDPHAFGAGDFTASDPDESEAGEFGVDLNPEDAAADDGWPEDDEEFGEVGHPLQELAQDLAMRAFDLVQDSDPDASPGGRLVTSLVESSAKLAGALDHCEDDYHPEIGYVLAVLKRCLYLLNESLAACSNLIGNEEDPDHRRALEALQFRIFELRDGVVTLRRELRGG